MIKTLQELKALPLSPSSINTFYQCPRKWYFTYVLGIREPPTPKMLRGTIVHRLVENVFKYKYWVSISKYFKENLPILWKTYHLDKPEYDILFKETELTLKMISTRYNNRIKMCMMKEKVNSKTHAWHMIRPKFREVKVTSIKHNLRGFIDAIEKGFDGEIDIIDYKTSELYRHQLTEDYFRQIKLYALMYHEMEGEYPRNLIIDFVRYGSVFVFRFERVMLIEAIDDIEYVRNKLVSLDEKDYPCSEHKYCENGEHKDVPKTN